MQITDVEQRISFLDAEHRRERADLDRLRGLAQTQAAAITHLSTQFADLVGEVQATQARLDELTTLNTSLAQLRAELTELVQTQTTRTRATFERLQTEDSAAAARDEELAQRVQGLRGDVDRTAREVADLRQSQSGQVTGLAEVAKQVQTNTEATAGLARHIHTLDAADDQQTERLTHLAEQVHTLFGDVGAARTGVEALRPRIETYTAEAANLYRLVQGLEERLTASQALAGELQDRLTRQNDATVEVGRALQSLRADLTTTQAQLTKFPHIEEALEQAKTELTELIRGFRAQNLAEQERITQERLQDRQLYTRALGDLEKGLEPIGPIQQRLAQGEREAARLNGLLTQLDARLDALAREMAQEVDPIPFLDEQIKKHDTRLGYLEHGVAQVDHKIDAKVAPIPFLDESILALNKRMDMVEAQQQPHVQRLDQHQERLKFLDARDNTHADRLDQIEARLPGLDRTDVELSEKVEFLADWIQRTATRLDELQRFEDELRRTLAEVVEAEKVRDTHREQRMAAWDEELGEHRRQMEVWQKLLRGYEAHHLNVNRLMEALQEQAKQMDHQQRASAEAQRIEAEKVRREVQEWQQDTDKRWAVFFKQRDWDWKEQRTLNQAHADFLARLEQWRNEDVQSAADLATRLDNKDRELLMRIEDLWEAEETSVKNRITALKAWLEEIQDTQAKSPKPRVPKPGEKIVGTDPRYRRP